MKTTSIEQTAQRVLEGAKQRGMKDVKVVASQSRNVSCVFRKGIADKVEESAQRSVTVHLYDDGKYSASTSNDFRTDALESFLDSAVALTRAMEKDPYRELTDPKLYEGRKEMDLALYDEAVETFSADKRNALAEEAEGAAMAAAGAKAISAEASMETQAASSYQVHSNGFEGSVRGTQAWLFTEISLKDEGDKRPSGWDVAGSRFAKDIMNASAVGNGAVERASLKLRTTKMDTQKCPMIVENRTVGRLLSGLLSAAGGRAVQQKRSFLEAFEGKEIASDILTILDNPFIRSGFGSRLYDSEGISARDMAVIEKGVFKNFFIDTYYGKKLNRPPTTGGSSNLVILPGEKSLSELIAGVDNGVLVRGFIGGNTNSTTGDFSLGVYGTRIETGELTDAVSELNISGNHKELWKKLAQVGNDPWMYSATRVPSLMFDEIQFSGN
ncbi:MAG: TldD/PmbA family protein [Deltaproteobacteria bacterium]|nr:TldD/PmbA family protein [Deltaproteobacteria bacterium]MBN2671839.1 TldD/PmbA family protein [Deltaproteobacteria bacterium]